MSIKDMFVKSFSHSIYRHSRAEEMMRKGRGSLTAESLKVILRDHFGKPNSICAHPDPAIGEDFQGETLASVVIDLEDRSLYLTRGPPCSSPYRRLEFHSLKGGYGG